MTPVQEVKFTHYGWFGICPVMLADLESGSPVIHERWKLLPLMVCSEVLMALYMNNRKYFDKDYEALFPIKVIGEFKKPKSIYFPMHDGDQ